MFDRLGVELPQCLDWVILRHKCSGHKGPLPGVIRSSVYGMCTAEKRQSLTLVRHRCRDYSAKCHFADINAVAPRNGLQAIHRPRALWQKSNKARSSLLATPPFYPCTFFSTIKLNDFYVICRCRIFHIASVISGRWCGARGRLLLGQFQTFDSPIEIRNVEAF